MAVSIFLFLHRLGDRDLWSSHEARAGMDARTILDDGTWLLPRLFDGRPELQKPPLYYWLVAAVGWARGGIVDAWSVRLPAAVAALLCVFAVGWGLWRGCGRPRAGLLAALVLATAMHFVWLARIARVDMPLTLAVTVAAGAFYLAWKQAPARGFRWRLLAWLAVAAGILLKGPIAAILLSTIVIGHRLVEGELSPWRLTGWARLARGLGLVWGVPLVAALTLPWFLGAIWSTDGEFFRVFILHHNFERGYGGSSLRGNPWYFYPPMFAADFLPWTPLLLFAVFWCHRRGLWRIDADARFGLVWLVAVMAVLSCSRYKRADYLLPAYPGAALFLGCIGEHWLRAGTSLWRVPRWVLPLFVAGGALIGWTVRLEHGLPAEEPFRDYRRFAAAIRVQAPAPTAITFFRTESHPLAFHVGRPLSILVEWQDLNARLRQPGTHYVVLPAALAGVVRQHVHGAEVEEVVRNTDLSDGAHEHPLLLLRARPLGLSK